MYRVVIADDEPKVSKLIKALIDWDGLGLELVGTAGDGIAALELIESQKPDIVITDIRMPGYDGIELISRAKSLYPEMDVVIISGYRHFDYAQQAIRFGVEDYLLKPLKEVEINGTLRKLTEKYAARQADVIDRDRFRDRMHLDVRKVHGQFVEGLVKETLVLDAASMDAIMESYRIEPKVGVFQGCIVKPDIRFDEWNPGAIRLLMEKCCSVVWKHLEDQTEMALMTTVDQKVLLILAYQEDEKKNLRKALHAIIDEIQSMGELFEGIKVTVGLGHAHSGEAEVCLPEMVTSLKEADLAVMNRLFVGAGRIIESNGGETDDVSTLSSELRKRLLRSLEIMDVTEMRAVIGEVLHPFPTDGHKLIRLMMECVDTLVFGLKNQNAHDQWVQVERLEFERQLSMCHRHKDALQIFEGFMIRTVEHVTAVRNTESNKPIREAQKYIQTHYREGLSLEQVSQMVGFNATYFSLLFKKETGMNFLEYVTGVRISEAKRLLADGNKTIADVAYEVGYSDVKHFSKVFAKVAGIHPSKYRKLYY